MRAIYLLSFILAFPLITLSRELVDKTVAIVNNEVILASEVKAFSKRADKSGMLDELLLHENSIDSLRKDKKLQLSFLINEKLMDSEIKRQNLTITMERVEQEIKDLSKRNNMTRAEMLAAVKTQGFTESEYQAFMKTRIERQSLVDQEIASKIRISDDDVFAFYLVQTGKKLNAFLNITFPTFYFLLKRTALNLLFLVPKRRTRT
jgi:peptidyl-prolyl cis-trans isomerase SurA